MPKSRKLTTSTRMGSSSNRMMGEFRPDTFNAEARTIEVVFTTGQGGKRTDWYNDYSYIEELDVTDASVRTERLDKGLSVIADHRTYAGIDGVFGITEAYRFEEGNKLVGTVRFASDEESTIKMNKVSEGILRHVSLGYIVHKYLKTREEQDKLDTLRAIDWEPTELSFVVTSFETENGTRSATRENEPTNTVDIVTEERNMNAIQLARLALLQGMSTRSNEEETELTTLVTLQQREISDAESRLLELGSPVNVARTVVTAGAMAVPVVAPVAAPVDVTAIRNQERAVSAAMLAAVRSAGLNDTFATEAFERGETIDNFRTLVIAELGNESSKNIINPTRLKSDNDSDLNQARNLDVENALMLRCSKGSQQKIEMTAGIREYQGLTLLESGRQYLEDTGMNTRGFSRQKLAERAFHSTSDFPLILANVMNKNLLASYAEVPQTFLGLGTKTTVNDFRDKHTYRLGDGPNLLPLGENGEYESGTFGESGEKYAISTFARKIGFSRKMLINDDMSAIDKVPSMMGAAGSRLESDIVWGLILNYDFRKMATKNIKMSDGKALFHVDHKNLATGTASALSKASLSALRLMGRKQKTNEGSVLNMTYNTLVMPSDLETLAEELLFNNYVANVSNETSSFRNKFEVRIEERLAVLSTTGWLAFSNMMDTFEYASLAGEEGMMTEMVQSTDVDGLTLKVRKDFGAGLVDHRGFAMSTGVA